MNFHKIFLPFLCLILLFTVHFSPLAAQMGTGPEIEQILNRFAGDYEQDVTFKQDVTFGINVDDSFWHIKARAGSDVNSPEVRLLPGEPDEPTFFFFTDFETLQKIDRGELNALTGAAKAFSSDSAPFDMDVMDGFVPDQAFLPTLLSTLFHFWTKGTPEIIPFGLDHTRPNHGAQASIFYYQPGFRSAYVAIKKGQHANENEKSKKNPFPTLLIGIKGTVDMVIDGKESVLTSGNAVLIPAGVSHEFLNPDRDEPFEGILLMFGEGA